MRTIKEIIDEICPGVGSNQQPSYQKSRPDHYYLWTTAAPAVPYLCRPISDVGVSEPLCLGRKKSVSLVLESERATRALDIYILVKQNDVIWN